MMPNAILLTSQVLALMTMFGMSTCAAERRIEIPLEQSGGLPVAEVVSALAQASGVTIERPAVKLTLPTQGLAGSLTKTLLGECLGPEVRLAFRPGVVVIAVDEDELAADRCAEWKRRLDELSARSVQAASRQQYYGMRALASFRANDPRRPTVCLVHGINSSSGGFVHVIPLLEQAGYGIVVFDYPFNQRLDDSCAQFRRDWIAFRKAAGENQPWAILAHSMGALVARSYVEGEGRTDRDVASMILIAPVNGGAHVARIQPVYQTISSLFAINSKRTTQALAQLSDGIGQAADDLLPGSAFLKRINGGSRPREVPYHILAGNSGVIPRDIRQQAQAQLETASRENGLFSIFSRAASREIVPLLDELTDGSGDGCVAVERTRLEGADDHVTIRANHAELIRAPLLYPDDGPVPCMPYVLRWLQADLKRKAQ
ncbi:MAG: esterase/lipase family protein [Isosphaeraceae bacterium]